MEEAAIGMDQNQHRSTFQRGKARIAFVVRDDERHIIQITSRIDTCESAHEAEVLALLWASKVADKKGWQNVEWLMDAAAVVKEVLLNDLAEE